VAAKYKGGFQVNSIKINEQISFLRKQKGITQEELAQVLGVTNQSVSKWESGSCCPDIQLLPELAKYFQVSVDELLGYRPSESFGDVLLKIKSLFQETDEKAVFDLGYKLAFAIAEGALTKGYKDYVPWNTDKVRNEDSDFYKWGFSACSEPEGNSFIKQSSVFISSNKYFKPITSQEVRDIYLAIEPLCNKTNIKVLYGLYELTIHDFDLYVSLKDISEKCNLPESEVEKALDNLPVHFGPDDVGYRIEGCFMHIPPILMMLPVK